MRSLRTLVLVAPIALTMACSSASGAEAEDDGDSPENVARTESALQSTAAVTSVLSESTRTARHFLADAWGAVREARTAECARITTQVIPRGVAISARFEDGCEIPVLGTVSGSLSVTVAVDRNAIGLDVSFASFTLGGVSLTGSTSIVTRGTATSVTMDVESVSGERTTHVTFGGTIVLDVPVLGATLGGSGSANGVAFSVTDVHVVLGKCYADAGLLAIGPVTVRFLPTTPSDAEVAVSAFGRSARKTLPSYGRCPR